MKKRCELCSNQARIYCEADGASLCSNCDDKVHSANFLVAKHLRNLLCHLCQSQTPWKASGTKLGPTVSVCSACLENSSSAEKQQQGRTEGSEETDVEFEEGEDDDDDDDELSTGSDEEEEEGGDNQVVPWSLTRPLPSSSTSSSEAVSSAGGGGGGFSALKKRTRGDADLDLDSEDEIGCTSLRFNRNIALTATSSPALENHKSNSSGFFRSVRS